MRHFGLTNFQRYSAANAPLSFSNFLAVARVSLDLSTSISLLITRQQLEKRREIKIGIGKGACPSARLRHLCYEPSECAPIEWSTVLCILKEINRRRQYCLSRHSNNLDWPYSRGTKQGTWMVTWTYHPHRLPVPSMVRARWTQNLSTTSGQGFGMA